IRVIRRFSTLHAKRISAEIWSERHAILSGDDPSHFPAPEDMRGHTSPVLGRGNLINVVDLEGTTYVEVRQATPATPAEIEEIDVGVDEVVTDIGERASVNIFGQG